MIGLELYDTAAEAFRAALEHGKGTMGTIERHGVEKELEDVERRALKERSKEQDHYSVLGKCYWPSNLLAKLSCLCRKGLKEGCTSGEIKKAYRTLCLKHHPDKVSPRAYRGRGVALYSNNIFPVRRVVLLRSSR